MEPADSERLKKKKTIFEPDIPRRIGLDEKGIMGGTFDCPI